MASLIPDHVSAAISVLFFPRLLLTEPYTRFPLGARAYSGVRPMWEPHASMTTSLRASRCMRCSLHAARASSLRSVVPSVFFLRVQPIRRMMQRIVLMLTCTPQVCFQIGQCISSVASGWASHCATQPTESGAPFFEGRPGIARGCRFPVSRRCFKYRLIVALETPKSLMISVREYP